MRRGIFQGSDVRRAQALRINPHDVRPGRARELASLTVSRTVLVHRIVRLTAFVTSVGAPTNEQSEGACSEVVLGLLHGHQELVCCVNHGGLASVRQQNHFIWIVAPEAILAGSACRCDHHPLQSRPRPNPISLLHHETVCLAVIGRVSVGATLHAPGEGAIALHE